MSSSTARLGLTIVGAVVGSFFGQPQLGFIIGAGLGYALFPPEGKTIVGRRLDDFKVSFSTYGNAIPIIYGTMEIGGNVVWSPGLVEHRVEEEVGGKGAPSTTVVSFLYTASFRINYSVGVAEAILRNWADGKLLVDKTGPTIFTSVFGFTVDIPAGPGNPAVRDFLGTSTQLPGPAEQADKGVANTPAYRGTVGQEWEDMALEDFGNRIPQMTAEIAMQATDLFLKDTITITRTGNAIEWGTDHSFFIMKETTSINNFSQIQQAGQDPIFNSHPSFPLIDAENFFYRARDNGGGFEIDKYNAITLVFLGSGNELDDPLGVEVIASVHQFTKGRIFGGISTDLGRNTGQKIFLTRGLASKQVVVVDINLLGNSFGGVLNVYDFPEFISGVAALVVDRDQTLWTMYSSGADSVLVKLDNLIGDIAQSFVVTGFSTHSFLAYEPITHGLILGKGGVGGNLVRWDIDTETVVGSLTTNFDNDSVNYSEFWNGANGGKLYLDITSSGKFAEFDVINMVQGRTWDPVVDFGVSSNISLGIYDPIHHAKIVNEGSDILHWLYLDRVSGDDITVRSIVEDVSSRVDLVAGIDIDATELTDTLPGYVVRSQVTARRALEPLATAFNFRSVESDFKIKFPKRGGASVGNIPQIDLGATAGEVPTTQALTKTRIAEEQLFETAIIEYIDPTFDNNPNTQQAKRSKEAINVGGVLKFDFPGALGNDQAAQIIERILFQAWSGRTSISTSVPLKHILKDPGDVITITKDNKTVTVELHDVKLGANSLIKIAGTIDDAIVHVSTATGADALGEEGQVIELTGPTEFFIMDIPLLRDIDEGDGIYVGAGSAEGFSWPGAGIFRGLDLNAIFPFTALTSSRNLDYGIVLETLPDHDVDIWDRTNSLTITLLSGALSSSTETGVLNGANAILVGGEIIQFVTAVLNADGTYTISTLLRGRRGTEFATGTHTAADSVIVLSPGTVLRVAVNLSDHLSSFVYRAITLGDSQFSSKVVTETLELRSQMPYAPSHVAGSISGNDWTFTLVRRTRVGGSWKDSLEVTLGETVESYEWDVMDGSTVVRTLTSTSETVGYTSDQQVTDFGGNQTTLELNVYQLSSTVGRGFVTNITLVGG